MFENNTPQQPQVQSQQPQQGEQATTSTNAVQPVYTMPEQYMPQGVSKSSKGGGMKTWLIIGGIAFGLFIILVALAVFVLQATQQQQPIQQGPTLTNQDVTGVNANDNTNANSNENANANENTNAGGLGFNINEERRDDIEDDLFNGNSNSNANSNSNSNSNGNTNTAGVFIDRSDVSEARDKDGDDLTDEEEELYGTGFSSPDSDKDGFTDGREVADGFSPAVEEETLLEDGLTLEYENDEFGWTIEYPSPWLASSLDSTKRDVLFTSDAVDGELVEVVITDNPDELTAAEWFASLYTDVDEDDLEEVEVGKLDGIVSPDGFQYHLAEDDVVISIIYNFGTKEKVHFMTTFQMMLNSFTYKAPKKQETNNSNDNSNSNENGNANTNASNDNSNSANSNTNSNANDNSNTNSTNTNNSNASNTNS